MKEGMLHFRLFSPLLRFFVLFCFVFVVVVFLIECENYRCNVLVPATRAHGQHPTKKLPKKYQEARADWSSYV